jgi:type IV pilus assembly protein PilW
MLDKQKGFTLIELMIALFIGLLVIGATITIYLITVSSSSDTVSSAKLNNDLDSTMLLMLNDIRRAGYWGGAVPGSDPKLNPFTQVPVANQGQPNIHIPTSNCILYSYDYDGDAIVDDNEYFGFKLENSEVRFRTSITDPSTYPSCIGAACCNAANGNWESITDSNVVTINTLTVTNTNTKCQNLTQNQTCATGVTAGDSIAESREIDIVIDAELTNDDDVSKSQTGTVKVRNDRIYTQP